MSIRSDILAVLRHSPAMLGDGAESVVSFIRSQHHTTGGFTNHEGQPSLQQTMCGVECLIALNASVPREAIGHFLLSRADRPGNLMSASALARASADLDGVLDADQRRKLREYVETYRSSDGGYHTDHERPGCSMHGLFEAVSAIQDLGCELDDAPAILQAMQSLRTGDGGYANEPNQIAGDTMTTAMAVVLLRELGAEPDEKVGAWLLKRGRGDGGFVARAAAPTPDLRVTAAALHALKTLGVRLGGLRDPTLDFIESLWSSRGGFFGSWADRHIDCRHTFDALFALGYLGQ